MKKPRSEWKSGQQIIPGSCWHYWTILSNYLEACPILRLTFSEMFLYCLGIEFLLLATMSILLMYYLIPKIPCSWRQVSKIHGKTEVTNIYLVAFCWVLSVSKLSYFVAQNLTFYLYFLYLSLFKDRGTRCSQGWISLPTANKKRLDLDLYSSASNSGLHIISKT